MELIGTMRARALVCALTGVLAVGVVVVQAASPAGACDCSTSDDQAALDAADVVFEGELLEYEPPPPAEIMSSTDPAIWTFGVSEVFKGEATQVQEVVSPVSGASCGLELPHEHATVLVFARHGTDAGTLEAGLCSGTRLGGAGAAFTELARPPVPVPVPEPAPAEPSSDGGNVAPFALGAGAVVAAVAFALHRRRRTA